MMMAEYLLEMVLLILDLMDNSEFLERMEIHILNQVI